MTTFILRRLGGGVVLIIIVTFLTFLLTYGANIPVARNILGPSASQADVRILESQLGLNRPVLVQYWSWLTDALQGNLGRSYFTGQPVISAMASRLPVTMSVVLVASVITLVVGCALGVASAVRKGVVDSVLQGLSTTAYVFPAIVLGIVFVYVFAITLKWVPAIGYVPLTQSPSGWFGSIILPSLVLAIHGVTAVASQVRGSLTDELSKEYIRTLRSRGFSEVSVVLKHALRNAASPALTVFSLEFITLFGSTLIIENIFALPGYGSYTYNAVVNGDLPAMMGVTLFSVALVVVVNLLVDILNGWVNPKARIA